MFLTKTYEVQDCVLYDANSYSSAKTLNLSLPSEWVLTWESNRKSNSSSKCCILIGVDDNNQFQCGTYGSGGPNGIQERINGSWQTAQTTSNAPLYTLQSNTLTYSNGSLSYSNGSQTVSKTPTISLDKIRTYDLNPNGVIQNVKLKPL